jgi:GDP-4-dehydro-6-deoxy-D-mannose reductase
MRRALITGHRGFTGRHLAGHLESLGYSVFGMGRSDGGDVRDTSAVSEALRNSRPQVVFHLAAAPRSAAPTELYSVGVLGTVTLLEAVVKMDRPPTVVAISSSAVYGRSHNNRRLSERMQPRPLSHHGTSKLAQEIVATRYARSRGLRVVVARPFNLLGPGLPTDLACGGFAAQIAHLEHSGTDRALSTGNLNPVRDFTDVRDAVRAYALLADHGRSGSIYNVCSGNGVSIESCLRMLLALATKPLATEVEESRLQSDDVPAQVGDFRRLFDQTGWRPTITVQESLADMLDHRRQELLI